MTQCLKEEDVFKVPVYWKQCSGMMLQNWQSYVDVAYPPSLCTETITGLFAFLLAIEEKHKCLHVTPANGVPWLVGDAHTHSLRLACAPASQGSACAVRSCFPGSPT